MIEDPGVRARLSMAVSARDSAEHAYGLVGDLARDLPPGERIRSARRLRAIGLNVLDRSVLIERTSGSTWAQIAEALGLTVEETLSRYEETWLVWSAAEAPEDVDASMFGEYGIGLRFDTDPEGTAQSLDAWYGRHAEPWDIPSRGPCAEVLRG